MPTQQQLRASSSGAEQGHSSTRNQGTEQQRQHATIRQGSRGPDVVSLQRRLNSLGHDAGAADGIFGRRTASALKSYQRAEGLIVDGIAGPQTWSTLTAGGAQGQQQGDSWLRRAQEGQGEGGETIDLEAAPIELASNAFENLGLRPQILQRALEGFDVAWEQGETNKLLITIVDFELPSDERRMWVIDLASGALLHHEFVAHGANSGGRNATEFSNTVDSHQSSLGMMRTAETYYGKYGYSLKLDGLEEDVNDNVRDRFIVMHPSDYVDDEYIERNGRAGRSWGCLALDPDVSGDVIRTIKGGSLIFNYYPDPEYLRNSEYQR